MSPVIVIPREPSVVFFKLTIELVQVRFSRYPRERLDLSPFTLLLLKYKVFPLAGTWPLDMTRPNPDAPLWFNSD